MRFFHQNILRFRHCRIISFGKDFILIMMFAFALSCSTLSPIDTSYTDYKSNDVKINDFSKSSIAILPFFSDDKYVHYRNAAEVSVMEAFMKQMPNLNILSPNDIENVLKQSSNSDIITRYHAIFMHYNIFSSGNIQLFSDLQKITNCHYIMYSTIRQKHATKIAVQGKPLKVFNPIELEIYMQVWDTKKGTIVWQGAGGASAIVDNKNSDTLALVHLAAAGLVQRVCNKNIDKPQNTQTLYNLQQDKTKEARFAIKTIIAGLVSVTVLVVYFIVSH